MSVSVPQSKSAALTRNCLGQNPHAACEAIATCERGLRGSAELPVNFQIHLSRRKMASRQVTYHYLPRELIERPIARTAIPISTWMRGTLPNRAEDLLSHPRLSKDGLSFKDHSPYTDQVCVRAQRLVDMAVRYFDVVAWDVQWT